ncbi:MAG TPA: RNA degradosome polyphosphate kinase, partial [Erysipelotrichaceae bacterium]|nr:RNA degradosome polyphosphate kinase [Erysipelotrichaceae bacterium]
SKICLITKVKDEVNSHVVLVSTGNFNENTAKQYTDLSILTSDPGITEDAISFFQNMAIGKLDGTYHSLLVAPVSLKPTVMDLMDREIAKGKDGYIFAKINAITDEEIIVKLKEASCAGVNVEMIVRGISCILPSVEGKTDRIRIRSVVGRYLEHSRIYIFGKGEEEKMYIASADFMTRNMERRVEIACPINDPEIRKTIHAYADTYLADNTKARLLHSNGRYHKIKSDDDPFCAQDALMDSAVGSNQTIARSPQRPATSAFKTKFKKEKKKKKKEKKEK